MHYDKINRKYSALQHQVTALTADHKKLQAEHKKVKQALDSTLHEVRRFSAEISRDAERLSRLLEKESPQARQLSDTILYTSGMVSSRLSFTDLELNPAAVSLQQLVRSGIYKKFEKASHILDLRSRAKGITIKMLHSSFIAIDTLPAFELVPFVILDNAIKYSPEGRPVTISFNETANHLHVSVASIGPYVEPDELRKIFDRGTRGKNAERLALAGDGLGLFLAKFLCDYHGISLYARSVDQTYSLNGVPYAQFEMNMEISTAG